MSNESEKRNDSIDKGLDTKDYFKVIVLILLGGIAFLATFIGILMTSHQKELADKDTAYTKQITDLNKDHKEEVLSLRNENKENLARERQATSEVIDNLFEKVNKIESEGKDNYKLAVINNNKAKMISSKTKIVKELSKQ